MRATLTPRLLFALLLSVGLTAAIFLPLAAVADGDPEDPKEDRGRDGDRGPPDRDNRTQGRHGGDEDEDERDVDAKVEHEGFEIALARRAAENSDRVNMGFQYPDARFRLQFQGRENESQTRMRLEANVGPLFEFRDVDADGRYDLGEPVVSAWALGDEGNDDVATTQRAEWQTPHTQDIVIDGQPGKKITVNATLGDQGLFELRFFVFGDFVDIGNSTLRPTGAKIDIEIRDYPYVASDTRLGLFLETRTQNSFKWSHTHEELADDEDGVAATQDVDGKPVTLLFTWKETATVDGVDTPVGSTFVRSKEVASNDGESTQIQRREVFVLSYARGALVVHDPEAYVSIADFSLALPIGQPLLVLAGAAAAATLVVFTLGPRMRRDR
jgi:hypothetical protein